MRLAGLIISCFISCSLAAQDISIIAPKTIVDNPISGQTINDAAQLLQKVCHCNVTTNDSKAAVQFSLPNIDPNGELTPTNFEKDVTYPYNHYPNHSYTWYFTRQDGRLTCLLKTTTYEGVSCGIYGLLQEQLGYCFIHARQSIFPDSLAWNKLPQDSFSGAPRFDKKGFHIHAEHPLEITEQLLDPTYPNALHDVKEYIDWLARNGQNYFEFNLLNNIDRKLWPAHAKAIVDYARSRGILTGIDLSLHMTQQKAFMLYANAPKSFRSKIKQLDANIDWVMQAGWDYVTLEFSTTEFSKGNMVEKEKLRLHLIDLLEKKYHTHIMGREHVVQPSKMLVSSTKQYIMDSAEQKLDKHRGLMVHTVMCYSATEEKAPVYRNENLRHMLDILLREKQVRETWFYPESAYWITFDNSIPMLLLPYLTARLQDIKTMDSLGVKGHITFSSGWEWCYWLVDWSIARWSWKYQSNGIENPDDMQVGRGFNSLFHSKGITDFFVEQTNHQEKYLKQYGLIRYMAAQNPTDEAPHPLDMQFQPRPQWKYGWISHHATEPILKQLLDSIALLQEFALENINTLSGHVALANEIGKVKKTQQVLIDELMDGLSITNYRALHRAATLQLLVSKRAKHIGANLTYPLIDTKWVKQRPDSIRANAQQVVNNNEQHYRYPVSSLAARHWGHTAYHFGYLYPAHTLWFWRREELQIQHNRYGPFYHSLWNIPRILGWVK